MSRFDELKARYPNLIPVHELRAAVSIHELAQYYGYVRQPRKGKSRPVLIHSLYQDTIIIKHPQDAALQLYQRAGDFADAGTIIDFVRHRLTTVFVAFHRTDQSEFRCVTSVLYDYLRINPDQRIGDHTLTPPLNQTTQPTDAGFIIGDFDLRPLQEDNYLTRRLITPLTLERPEFRGKILTQITYFDPSTRQAIPVNVAKDNPDQHYRQFTNVAFPYHNGLSPLASGLELRNDALRLHAPGSDRTSSVFVSNPPPITRCFVVTESVIDALSHQQLRTRRGEQAFDTIYFASGGQITPQQVLTITRLMATFTKAPRWTLELAFDNDLKGYYYDLLFIQQLATLRFPLTPIPGKSSHYHYRLPQGEAFQVRRQALLEQIEHYNRSREQTTPTSETQRREPHLTIDYHPGAEGAADTLHVPATCPDLTAMTSILLALTGLGTHVRVTKAKSKDFNEDLATALINPTP